MQNRLGIYYAITQFLLTDLFISVKNSLNLTEEKNPMRAPQRGFSYIFVPELSRRKGLEDMGLCYSITKLRG